MFDLDALAAQGLDAGSSMFSATPIPPQQGCGTHVKGMEEHTHLTRFCRRFAIPLTLLPQRTGATAADAGPIHHAQTSISFSALLMGDQLLIGRATQRAIWLESKVLT